MSKTALITGVTGQDGAYLSHLLLKKGYTVHGIKRRASMFNTGRIDDIYQDPHIENKKFILHHGDLSDSTNIIRIIQLVQPDEIYNLRAMSHVQVSFEERSGRPPLKLIGKNLSGTVLKVDGSINSKIIEAKLLLSPSTPVETIIELKDQILQAGYVGMTLKALQYMGVNTELKEEEILI